MEGEDQPEVGRVLAGIDDETEVYAQCPRKSFSFPRISRPIQLRPAKRPYSEDTTTGVSSSDDGISAKAQTHLPTSKEPTMVEDMEMDSRYFPEDAADTNYHGADPFKLWCESCGHLFANVLHFACHHRRHQGPMLFTCPSCSEGFPNLQSCLDHEVEKHGKVIQYASPGTSQRNDKKKSTESYDTDDGNSSSVCVSNSVNLYRGPIVSSLPDCVAVEKLHGVYGRTIYTRLLDWL